jgi:hypothetical protein
MTALSARDRLYPACIVLFSFGLSAWSAGQSLNNDQSMFFHAGLYQLHGRHIFEDYFLPFSLLTVYMIVPFFKLIPAGGWAFMVATGVQGAVAAWLGYAILAGITERRYARLGSLFVAVSFLPVMGVFWHDHWAYLFLLAGVWLYWDGRPTGWRTVLAAFFLAGCYHHKPTIGITGLLAFGLSTLLTEGFGAFRVRAHYVLAGWYIGWHAVVLGLVAWCLDMEQYRFYAIEMAAGFARYRPLSGIFEGLIFPNQLYFTDILRGRMGVLAMYPMALVIYAAYAWLLTGGYVRMPWQTTCRSFAAFMALPRTRWLLFLTLSTVFCAVVLGRSPSHRILGSGLVLALLLPGLPGWRAWLSGGLFVAMALGHIALQRHIGAEWPPFYAQTWLRPLHLKPLYRTDTDSAFHAMNRELITFLADKGEYGTLGGNLHLIPLALGRPSATPHSLFMYHLTVPDTPEREQRWSSDIIRLWEKRRIQYLLVGEAGTELGGQPGEYELRLYADDHVLPTLKAYIRTHFEPEKRVGWTWVLRRKQSGGRE